MFVAPLIFSFVVLGVVAGVVMVVSKAGIGSNPHGEARPPLDGVEVVKSGTIHVGLFLALIACAVGLIDLMQSVVEGDRIAGSNPDVARGLSLLIVGGPVFGFLVLLVSRRYADRAEAGDTQPHLGWSVYLVAALTTTLIVFLVSVAQVTESLTSDSGSFRPEELMQLIGWLGLWLAHWFVLRPHFKVVNVVHLAIGSMIGLGWVVTGIGAVIYRILGDAYSSVFSESLISSHNVAFWIVFGLVGFVVWGWHWHSHLNTAGSVEGDWRHSPLWFVVVVVAGVLPGLIAILTSVTAMISGVLIWFIGSTDENAADFFEPVVGLTSVLLVGFVSWAYHRWELNRGGQPERNESLRFHDYVVLAVGLVGVVGAVAVIVSQFFKALAAGTDIAGDSDIVNALIVAVTVMVGSAAVWWWQWSAVNRHHGVSPVKESNSIWRKLYVIATFGIGGVVLAVSMTWVLFVLLRDLLDSTIGHNTVQDLADPVGWSIALVAATWYHFGVWQADRAVLVANRPQPDPPRPPTPATAQVQAATAIVRDVVASDYGELFTLQRAAAAQQAVLAGTLTIAGLSESFDAMTERLEGSRAIVATVNSRIVGLASRATTESAEQQVLVAPDQPHDEIASLLRTKFDEPAEQSEPAESD